MTIVTEFKVIVRGNGRSYAASVYLPGEVHPLSTYAGAARPEVAAAQAVTDAVLKVETSCGHS